MVTAYLAMVKMGVRFPSTPPYAPVAQLDRAFGFGPKGQGFKSFQVHHIKIKSWS